MHKRKLWSTDRTSRQRLREEVWEVDNSTIVVVLSFRELGTHMTATLQLVGATVSNRSRAVLGDLAWLQRSDLSYHDKPKLIMCKFHPKALYGVEAAPPIVRQLETYRAQVSNTVAPHAVRTCNSLVFEMLEKPLQDVDLLTLIL